MWQAFLFLMIFLFSAPSCVQSVKHASDPGPAFQQPPSAAADDSEAILVSIRQGYLQLASDLQRSPQQESQDLAHLAAAVGRSNSSDLAAYLQSDHSRNMSEELAEAEDLPAPLANSNTRAAAVTLISLGTLAFGARLLDFNPLSIRPYTHLAIALATIVIGSRLAADPSEENQQSARDLVLAAGVLSTVHGVGLIGLAHGLRKIDLSPDSKFFGFKIFGLLAEKPWLIPDTQIFQKWSEGSNLAEVFERLVALRRKVHAQRLANLLGTETVGDFDAIQKMSLESITDLINKGAGQRTVAINKMLYETMESYQKLPAPSGDHLGPAVRKRLIKGSLFAALGVGIIMTSQLALQLKETASDPLATLARIQTDINRYQQLQTAF